MNHTSKNPSQTRAGRLCHFVVSAALPSLVAVLRQFELQARQKHLAAQDTTDIRGEQEAPLDILYVTEPGAFHVGRWCAFLQLSSRPFVELRFGDARPQAVLIGCPAHKKALGEFPQSPYPVELTRQASPVGYPPSWMCASAGDLRITGRGEPPPRAGENARKWWFSSMATTTVSDDAAKATGKICDILSGKNSVCVSLSSGRRADRAAHSTATTSPARVRRVRRPGFEEGHSDAVHGPRCRTGSSRRAQPRCGCPAGIGLCISSEWKGT